MEFIVSLKKVELSFIADLIIYLKTSVIKTQEWSVEDMILTRENIIKNLHHVTSFILSFLPFNGTWIAKFSTCSSNLYERENPGVYQDSQLYRNVPTLRNRIIFSLFDLSSNLKFKSLNPFAWLLINHLDKKWNKNDNCWNKLFLINLFQLSPNEHY